MKTVRQHINLAQQQLCQISESPRLDAELLLAYVLKKDRSYLFSHDDSCPSSTQSQLFQNLVGRRSRGIPVAYLLRQREFYGLTLEVSPAVLVPRPETELLVDLALARIPIDAEWQLADMGTGSGAIALALAKQRPRCTITATDRSAAALSVARRNAQQHQLTNISFEQGSWYEALKTQCQIIVSNPPYVADNDARLNSDSLKHEPLMALTPGNDGFDAIKIIIGGATKHLFNKGWLILEHGSEQATTVRTLLRAAGFGKIESQRDLAGHERVTMGQWLPG